MDWSGRGIPKMIRTKPDRFDYVYAKRLEDFFKPPKLDTGRDRLELGIFGAKQFIIWLVA